MVQQMHNQTEIKDIYGLFKPYMDSRDFDLTVIRIICVLLEFGFLVMEICLSSSSAAAQAKHAHILINGPWQSIGSSCRTIWAPLNI